MARSVAAFAAVAIAVLIASPAPATAFRKLQPAHRAGRGKASIARREPRDADVIGDGGGLRDSEDDDPGDPEPRAPMRPRSSRARTARRHHGQIGLDEGDDVVDDGGPSYYWPSYGERSGPGWQGDYAEPTGPYRGDGGESHMRLLLFSCFGVLSFAAWGLLDPLPGNMEELQERMPKTREEAVERLSALMRKVSNQASAMLGLDNAAVQRGTDSSLQNRIEELARVRREMIAQHQSTVASRRQSAISTRSTVRFEADPTTISVGTSLSDAVQTEGSRATRRATELDTDLIGDEIQREPTTVDDFTPFQSAGAGSAFGEPTEEPLGDEVAQEITQVSSVGRGRSLTKEEEELEVVEGAWNRSVRPMASSTSSATAKKVGWGKAQTLELGEDGEATALDAVDLRQSLRSARRSLSRRQSTMINDKDPDDFWVYEQNSKPSKTLAALLSSRSKAEDPEDALDRVVTVSRARLDTRKMATALFTPANMEQAHEGLDAFRQGEKLEKWVGIDLGTNFMRCAVYTGSSEDFAGVKVIASQPAFAMFGMADRVFGEDAQKTLVNAVEGGAADDNVLFNLENSVWGLRRLIGRKLPDMTLYTDSEETSFQLDFMRDGTPRFIAYDYGEEKGFLLEQVAAMMLLNLKTSAEEHLDGRIEDIVVTVPACFNELQRSAVKAAAEAAGMTVKRMLNDPTAAAIAYDAGVPRGPQTRLVMMIAMGGGTFDCSIVELKEHRYRVLFTSGDAHFGGTDIDDRLMMHCLDDFISKTGVDIAEIEDFEKFRLRQAVIKAKHELSEKEVVKIEVENLLQGLDYVSEITRDDLETACLAFLHAFQKHLRTVCKAADKKDIQKESIAEVVFVGGSGNMRMLQEIVTDYFVGSSPVFGFDPEKKNNEVVIGAALMAAALSGEAGGALPAADSKDVASLTLGNANAQGRLIRIVPRNTPVPVIQSFVGITYHDDQDNIQFDFYQGDMVRARDNYLLGSFVLENIPAGPRGTHKAEVMYEIDEDGMVQLSTRLLTGSIKQAKRMALTEQPEPILQEHIDAMLERRQEKEEQEYQMDALYSALSYLSQSCNWTRDELNDPDLKLARKDFDAIDVRLKETLAWLQEVEDRSTLNEVHAKQKELEELVDGIFEKTNHSDFRVRRASLWAKTGGVQSLRSMPSRSRSRALKLSSTFSRKT